MSDGSESCRFELPGVRGFHCSHVAEFEGLCIFHVPKRPDECFATTPEKLANVARDDLFSERFSQLLDELARQDPELWDFRGFSFPFSNIAGRVFPRAVAFDHAMFLDYAPFDCCRFETLASFRHVEFCRGANFNRAVFEGLALFENARFRVDPSRNPMAALFHATEFKADADFEEAMFATNVWFLGSVFFGVARFEKAVFRKDVEFVNAVFRGAARFIGGRGDIHGIETRCFEKRAVFHDLVLGSPGEVLFEGVDLGEASFLGTDIKRVNFTDVTWHRRQKLCGLLGPGRRSLADEFRLPPGEGYSDRDLGAELGGEIFTRHFEEGDMKLARQRGLPHRKDTGPKDEAARRREKRAHYYTKVKENYGQLVAGREIVRDYDAADDFHVGEMETRRRIRLAEARSPWRRFVRRFLDLGNFYRILSRYGTSYIHALIWLLSLILVFGFLSLSAGIGPDANGPGGGAGMIRYGWRDWRVAARDPARLVLDLGKALTIPFSLVLDQETIYRVNDEWWWLVPFVQVPVLSVVLGLFTVALRHRFRRRSAF
jgi:uncharacterized protein YjbI with pentapeptide repeats